MRSFIEELNQEKIIDSQDIMALKNYIDGTYPHLDVTAKSNLLAKSIHNILDIHLKGFDQKHKSKLKINLIKNILSKNINILTKSDVVNTVINSKDTSDTLLKDLITWVNTSSNHRITMDTLKNHMINKANSDNDNIRNDTIELEHANSVSQNNIPDTKKPLDTSKEAIYNNETNRENNKFISLNYSKGLVEFLKANGFARLSHMKDTILDLFDNSHQTKYAAIFAISFFLVVLPFSKTIVSGIDKIVPFNSIEQDTNNLISYEDVNLKEAMISSEAEYESDHIPQFLKYKEVDILKLQQYLKKKNSMLWEEPYLNAIISSSRRFNINPLILFAIAGHEQGFVPSDHPKSKLIANNPYNVFESWEKYNTDILDSSTIAARTVSNLLKDRKEEADPFKWINRKYAQDQNWWKGVRSIFSDLEEVVK